MIPIKDLFNKIKWDKREEPSDFVFYYLDRIENRLLPLKYKDIKRLEGNFMVVEREGKETNIPLHRVRKVEKRGTIIWKR